MMIFISFSVKNAFGFLHGFHKIRTNG